MDPSLRVSVTIGLLAFGTTGCATVGFQPAVQAMGEYKNTQQIADAADEMAEHSADDVKVLVEALPDGMSVKDGEFEYDHERYELLGKVTADYKDPSGVNMGLWFYDYKESESWRRGLCVWQVPLSWVTLTLWAWLVPAYYPCRVGAGSEESRREDIIDALRRATKALDGNLVVVTGIGGIDFMTVNSSTGVVVAQSAVSALKGLGYAFRVK